MLDTSFIQSVLDTNIQDEIINGGAVLIGNTEKTLLSVTRGFATNAHDIPMTLDTAIDGASTTKVVAGITSLLILKDSGCIDFDRPFTEYLPEYTAQLKEPITVRELANHLSGYLNGGPLGGDALLANYTGETLLPVLLSLPPQNPKTTCAHYSCWNYHLLAKIIENVSGQRLDDFCMKEIFAPLHMDDTALGHPRQGVPANRIAQTFGTAAPGIISDPPAQLLWGANICTANAGLFSTARDYAKLLCAYLNHGTPIFSNKALQECMPDTADQTDGYRRFGWCIWDYHQCPESFGYTLLHSGWSGQTILLDFKHNSYIIVLTTRCGDYEKAKCARFDIINHVFREQGM